MCERHNNNDVAILVAVIIIIMMMMMMLIVTTIDSTNVHNSYIMTRNSLSLAMQTQTI